MKNFSLSIFLLVIFIVICLPFNFVSAAANNSLQADNAKILSKLGIVNNLKIGNSTLKTRIKKCEFIALVVKMLGYEEDEHVKDVSLPYKDIDKSQKEYNNIKIAYKYGIILHNEKGSLYPNSYINYSDALVMILNGLGYKDSIKALSAGDIAKKAEEFGIAQNLNIPLTKQLTCGEAYIMIYNSLTVGFSGYVENNDLN